MSSFRIFRKKVKYTLLVAAIRALLAIIRILPRKAVIGFLGFLGGLAYSLLKEERVKAINNLNIAYGHEKSQAEIRAMAREVFVNLGKSGAEFACRVNQKDPAEFIKHLEVKGREHLQEAYEKGKGVLLLVSHMGSWECIALAVPLLGFPMYAIGKKIGNEQLNALLFESRGRAGVETLARGSSYKTMLKVMTEKKSLLAILIDQDTEVRGVFVDFYGMPAHTPIGAAMLAMDSGAPVLPVFYLKKDDDTYELVIEKEQPLIMSGNRRQDMEENTRRFHAVIEKYIKKYPTQWVWIHNRWKTTPDMDAAKK